MRRPISIRRRLLLDQILVIVLLGGGLIGATFVGARQAVLALSSSIIDRAVDQTESELLRFFSPADRTLQTIYAWNQRTPLNLGGGPALMAVLGPFLRQNTQFSSLTLAEDNGHQLIMRRHGEGWQIDELRSDEWGNQARRLEWRTDDSTPVASRVEIAHDPRASPWIAGARERLRSQGADAPPSTMIHWTEPYILFESQRPGITASIALPYEGGTRIIAVDVLLEDVTDFTRSIDVSLHGGISVLTADGRLIAIPDDPQFGNVDETLLRRPQQLGTPLVDAAIRAFANRASLEGDPVSFFSEGRLWWGQIRPFPLGPDRELRIAVLLPDDDLGGDREQIRLWILAITLAVLLGAVLRAMIFSRRLSSPIEELVRRSDRISAGDLDSPGMLDSGLAEVQVLAEAQDRMRRGLRSLLKLERDLQIARQIQQRSFPQALPALTGFDVEGWSEPAEETGGDTYDVIGYSAEGRSTVLQEGSADRAMLLLADATGHGVGPAISVTQVRAMLRMAVRTQEDLASFAAHLNEQLYADLPANRFITVWLGQLDTENHRLTSFSAGQAPLLHYRAASDEFDVLDADAPPLGILPTIAIRLPLPIELLPGDLFIVLSDGFYEATNADDEEFELERVLDVVRRCRQATSAEIVAALRQAVSDFTGNAPFADDRTALIVKRT